MMEKEVRKRILVVLGWLLLIASPFLLYALIIPRVFTSGDIPHKSDGELIANFQPHKSEFNELIKMISEDTGLQGVSDNSTTPKNPQGIGISHGRINEYRKLHRRVGVTGFFALTKNYVQFIASAQGLAVSGSSKGYLYAEHPPPNIVENIDEYRLGKKGFTPVHRHIEGNWYLFFEAN